MRATNGERLTLDGRAKPVTHEKSPPQGRAKRRPKPDLPLRVGNYCYPPARDTQREIGNQGE